MKRNEGRDMGKSEDNVELMRIDWNLYKPFIASKLSALTMGVT